MFRFKHDVIFGGTGFADFIVDWFPDYSESVLDRFHRTHILDYKLYTHFYYNTKFLFKSEITDYSLFSGILDIHFKRT